VLVHKELKKEKFTHPPTVNPSAYLMRN